MPAGGMGDGSQPLFRSVVVAPRLFAGTADNHMMVG
jgi:hypothetical protein